MNAPSLLVLPVARASAPSNRSNTPPKTTSRPVTSHSWAPAVTAAMQAMPKPISVSAFGVRPTLPNASAIGVMRPRIFARVSGETSEPLTRRPGAAGRSCAEPEDLGLAAREAGEGLRLDRVDRLAPVSLRRDEADLAQLAQVPGDQRLRQADVLDQLRDRRRPVREPRTMRRRFTSARVLWNSRSSRRSSGWSTTEAMVLRMRAGEGDTGGLVPVLREFGAVGSTAVYINGR